MSDYGVFVFAVLSVTALVLGMIWFPDSLRRLARLK